MIEPEEETSPSEPEGALAVGLAAVPSALLAGLSFGEAMEAVAEGKRVTRHEWGNPDIWLAMFMWSKVQCPECQHPFTSVPSGAYLTIHHADGKAQPVFANDGDLKGHDWVILS